MNCLTKTFLVLLRLAIGWHFLFEGVEKVSTYYAAPPRDTRTDYGWPIWRPFNPEPKEKSKPARAWTSEAYLRGANGPAADCFHWLAGDRGLAAVTVRPGPADNLAERLPPGLEKDWRAYFEAFVSHYHVQDNQLEQAQAVLQDRKEAAVIWLEFGFQITPGIWPVVTIEPRIPESIQKYQDALKKVAAAGAPIDREEAQAAADKLRGELRRIADDQTAAMKSALGKLLTNDQKAEYGPLPEPVVRKMADWDRLDWMDFATRWGLIVIGGCLLLGLFTRSACVAGALFLLMLFLAMPPFPWLPANPKAEGHYLYVNKNLIEMLALLTLATARSGRWVGLDALWPILRRRSRGPREIVQSPPSSKEPFHGT